MQTSSQGRLNNMICPGQRNALAAPTYTTTRMNKTVNVDKINNIFIVMVLPTKSVLSIKKHDIHNIHRLA